MRRFGRPLAMGGLLFLLTSCGVDDGAAEHPSVTEDAALSHAVDTTQLQENRTQSLGDNSSVIALVAATGAEAVGEHTLELETDSRPHALIIDFSSVAPGVTAEIADDLMTDRAVLLMATIDNADEIRWNLPEQVGQEQDGLLTRADAEALVGAPVADTGATADGLNELVEDLEDA